MVNPRAAARTQRVWIVGELYYPELAASGWYATGLAESLAGEFDVRVICAQPNYDGRGTMGPRREIRNHVRIVRCGSLRLNRHSLWRRAINALQLTVSMTAQSAFRMRRGDALIVDTNPFSLPPLIALCCRLRGVRCIVNLQDLYPDTLVRAGVFSAGAVTVRLLEGLSRVAYRNADEVVVDGRDALRMVAARSPSPDRVRFIPLWADLDTVAPVPGARERILGALGIRDRFVAQYSGTMGRLHDLDTILDAAETLAGESRVHFLLRGSGAKRAHVEARVRRGRLRNVTVLDLVPRADLAATLNACDVGLMALVRDAQGVAIPSRLYNVLAAGRPMVAVADEDTELAAVVREEGVGWVSPPGDPQALADLLRKLADAPDAVRERGARARAVALERYPKERTVASFRDCLNAVLNRPGATSGAL